MRKLLLSVLLTVAAVPAARGADRYFVVFFASQAPNAPARQAHTFATFLKADVPAGKVPSPEQVKSAQAITISWLPADGDIRLLATPVAGRNYTFKESLAFATANGMSTTARGPFETTKEIYERALKQKGLLESGKVAYKAIDLRIRPDVVNCIHAVSDIFPGPPLDTGTSRGDEATDMVASHFRPQLVEPQKAHLWALRHLDPSAPRVTQATEPEYGFTVLPAASP